MGPAPKRLALFADGTGNSSSKLQKTNVWRLFQALDQRDPHQLAFYDDGVGTSSNKYLAAIGLAFGWGLKRNVIALYKFVCRNYDAAGTDIYGFGFSRGAFTMRVLVGLIASEGLVTYRSEEELNRNAAAAYRHYRAKHFPSYSPIVKGMRKLRDWLFLAKDTIKGYRRYEEVEKRSGIQIRFLGLWDTVEAYGMPIEELKRGIDWVLWPMMFGNTTLSPCAKRACHALSLDDERQTFHPLLWDEEAEAKMVEEGKVQAGRITQIWFAGVHSNLGGGYPEDQLSLLSLYWMMVEAQANDLVLEKNAIESVEAAQSPYARIYDSRAGAWAFYRYSPRRIPIGHLNSDKPILPIVHGSVVLRMAFGSDAYAPISLPYQFWVLSPDGELLPMQGFEQLDATKKMAAGARLMRDDDSDVAAAKARLKQAMASLAHPNHDAVSLVWDTVFWRRAVYFLTVVLAAVLLLFPWVGGSITELAGRVLSWSSFDAVARGPVNSVVDMLSAFVPAQATRWTAALVRYPVEFGSLAIGIVVALYGSSILQARIHDRARLAWLGDAERKKNYVGWLAESHVGWRNGMLAGFVVFGLVFVVALVAGGPGNERSGELGVITAIFAVLLLWRTLAVRKEKKLQADDGSSVGHPTAALQLARWLRKNTALNAIWSAVLGKAVPIVFALGILLLGFFVVNRAVFDSFNAAGAYCESTLDKALLSTEKLDDSATIDLTSLCHPTGFVLREGHTYRITLTTTGNWFDRTGRADVAGFGADSFTHYFATLMKRWWFEDYFTPIARIGRLGNDEYALKPADPFDPHFYCINPRKYGRLTPAADVPDINACAAREGARVTNASSAAAACGCCPKAEIMIGDDGRIAEASTKWMMSCSPTPPGRLVLVADVAARTTGELFLSVNDAVAPLFGSSAKFFSNNTGSAVVTVKRAQQK